MIRAPQLIARYLREKKKQNGATEASSLRDEVTKLASGLSNIGKAANFDHRECHAVMKKINGDTPLRGFAREQRYSVDRQMALLAENALQVAGDEGKLLIDEEGNVVGANGKTVNLQDDTDDQATKAVNALRQEVLKEFKSLRQQIEEAKRSPVFRRGRARMASLQAKAIANDEIRMQADDPESLECKHSPLGLSRRRRRRHPDTSTDAAFGSSLASSPTCVPTGPAMEALPVQGEKHDAREAFVDDTFSA